MICEKGCDSPRGAEDRDDEEDEDVVWCQSIMRGILMDEPG